MDISKGVKQKILIFSTAYLPFIGGAELAVKEITDRVSDFSARGGPAFGWDMITARLNRKLSKFERIGEINVYRIGFGIPAIDKCLLAFFGHRFAQKLHKKNQYDLIWSIMASYSGFAAMFFKKKNPQLPFLLTLQEGDYEPGKKLGLVGLFFKKIIKKADYIQTISNYLKELAKQSGAKTEIEVVPNGADLGKLKAKSEKRKANERIIITTSRLVHKNGIDVLIRAISNLKSSAQGGSASGGKIPNLKLQILGSGPDEKKLKSLAKELRVEDVVQFLGHIEPEKVYDYLAQADVFVRPSRSEGLGNSFLEAMGAGVPIIGTNVGGIPDFLKDSETGLFCKVDDPQDLAEKIKLLVRDENLAEKLVQNGKELVLKKYSWDNIAQKMQNIFNKL